MALDRHLETFQNEATDLLTEIEAVVLIIEERPDDPEAINRLFRAVHTLKGSGGMFGQTHMVELAHRLETVMDLVRSDRLAITRPLIDLVLASRDQLAEMVEALGTCEPWISPATADIIVRLERFLPAPAEARAAPPAPPAGKAGAKTTAFRIRFVPGRDLFAGGMDPASLIRELHELGDCRVVAVTDGVPPLAELDPQQCYLAWDLVLDTAADRNAICDVFMFVEDNCRIEITDLASEYSTAPDAPLPRLGDILVDRGDVGRTDMEQNAAPRIGQRLAESGAVSPDRIASALSEQETLARHQETARKDSVRVPSAKLDALINLVGELVTNQARISQIAGKLGDTELETPIEEADRLTAELRDIVLNIRMMPIGTTFSRFKRLVRDLSANLGKEIDLVTEGEETELDKTVIERLGEPLVHLIRNCIDHGIEGPDERERAGKPRRGTIRLVAAHQGASVVISIRDDGRGLDAARIRAKAIAKGLVAADRVMTDPEIHALVFAPGLSTAERVTDVSGRGVGMDAVRREIDSLRGTIDITSDPGRGSRIDLFLPLTLAIIDGLLVDVAGDRYVVPLSIIEECLELTDDRFAISHDRNLIKARGSIVPLIRLRQLFGLGMSHSGHDETVVVKAGEERVGVVVDRVVGNHQTVIKSLGPVYREADCISGATIMGDGNVALILDVAGLVRAGKAEEARQIAGRHADEAETP